MAPWPSLRGTLSVKRAVVTHATSHTEEGKSSAGRAIVILPANTSEGDQDELCHNQGRRREFYKDWGKGQPIVFSHGWPLSADDWDAQMLFFLRHGYRVIAHDRRGHGRSSAIPLAAARSCATLPVTVRAA